MGPFSATPLPVNGVAAGIVTFMVTVLVPLPELVGEAASTTCAKVLGPPFAVYQLPPLPCPSTPCTQKNQVCPCAGLCEAGDRVTNGLDGLFPSKNTTFPVSSQRVVLLFTFSPPPKEGLGDWQSDGLLKDQL